MAGLIVPARDEASRHEPWRFSRPSTSSPYDFVEVTCAGGRLSDCIKCTDKKGVDGVASLVAHGPHVFTKGDHTVACPGNYGDCPITMQIEAAYRAGQRDAEAAAVLKAKSATESAVEVSFADDIPDLIKWWVTWSTQDIMSTQAKVEEYGGYNMVFMGRALLDYARNAKDLPENPTDGYLQELAVWFYEVGKLGRALVALQNGKSPSDDTIFDVGYYAMMMRRMRQNGVWP